MTEDEVYDFLMGPHRKRLEIIRKQKVIEELNSCLLPGAIRYDKDRVQSTPSDQMTETVCKIIELEEQVERLKAERCRLIIELNDTLDRLDNDLEKVVLTDWYINRTRPSKIADNIGYSERRMYHFKKEGVQHLGELLKNISVNCS